MVRLQSPDGINVSSEEEGVVERLVAQGWTEVKDEPEKPAAKTAAKTTTK